MDLIKNPAFGRDAALQLIKGLENAQAKWKEFDKWLEAQLDCSLKITKGSIIKALIIEASGLIFESTDTEDKTVKIICQDFRRETVEKMMERLSEKERQLINKKYASTRALISIANKDDKAPEGKSTTKKLKTGKIALLGSRFHEVKEQLPPFLEGLSDEDFQAFWQIVNSAFIARKVQEHKIAS